MQKKRVWGNAPAGRRWGFCIGETKGGPHKRESGPLGRRLGGRKRVKVPKTNPNLRSANVPRRACEMESGGQSRTSKREQNWAGKTLGTPLATSEGERRKRCTETELNKTAVAKGDHRKMTGWNK